MSEKNINTSPATTVDFTAIGYNASGQLVGASTIPWTRRREVIKDITVTAYTLIAGDEGLFVIHTNGSASIITVPTDAVLTDWPVGGRCSIMRAGNGTLRVNGAAGVTLKSASRPKLRANGSVAELVKIAADTWVLTGDTDS